MLPGLYYNNRVFYTGKMGIYTALYWGNYSADRLKDKNGNNVGTAMFTAERDLGPNGEIPAGLRFTSDLDPSIDINIVAL